MQELKNFRSCTENHLGMGTFNQTCYQVLTKNFPFLESCAHSPICLNHHQQAFHLTPL